MVSLKVVGDYGDKEIYGEASLDIINLADTCDLELADTYHQPEIFGTKDDYAVELTIKNNGQTRVSESKIEVLDADDAELYSCVWNDLIVPGDTVITNLMIPTSVLEEKDAVKIRISPLNVADVKPADNEITLELKYEDIVLENLTFGLKDDGKASILADVVNRGRSDQNNIKVQLIQDSIDGKVVDTKTVDKIEVLDLESVSFEVDAKDCAVYYVKAICEGDAFTSNNTDYAILRLTSDREAKDLKITFEEYRHYILTGDTTSLKAIRTTDKAEVEGLTWKSSDETIATVDENGVVTGLAAGEVDITASRGDKTATCKVMVSDLNLTTGQAEYEILEGETVTIRAINVDTQKDEPNVTWSSSDETVLTIDSKGVATALKAGTVTVTVSKGSRTATCNVVVKSYNLVPEQETYEIYTRDTVTINVSRDVDEEPITGLTWSSDKEEVATVDQKGVVTGVAAGKATITGTWKEKTVTCKIIVSEFELAIEQETYEVLTEETIAIRAINSFTNKVEEGVIFTSSNEEILTVDEKGIVTGKKVGTAKITATKGTRTATCTVNVKYLVLNFGQSLYEVLTRETCQLDVKCTVDDKEVTGVTFSSSDEKIATVDEKGVVTGVTAGKAMITATRGKKTATCKISVSDFEMEVDQTVSEVLSGETMTLHAIDSSTKLEVKDVTWSSSDESILKVDENGVVSGVKVGTATVTVKKGLRSATCTVTVKDMILAFREEEFLILRGESAQATVIDTLTDQPAEGISFLSENPEIASVSASGEITAVGSGITMIQAVRGERKASCKVIVTNNVAFIELTQEPKDTIGGNAIGKITVKLNKKFYPYTGLGVEPVPTVTYEYQEYGADGSLSKVKKLKLVNNSDFVVTYENNVDVTEDQAYVVLSGIGSYYGSVKIPFEIRAKSASGLTMDPLQNMELNGDMKEAIIEKVTIRDGVNIVSPDNYDVVIDGDTGTVGVKKVSIIPKKNYTGKANKAKTNITLVEKGTLMDASTLKLTVNYKKLVYSGKAIKPSVTVKDASGKKVPAKNYKLIYVNNVNAGTASVYAIGQGQYIGTSKAVNFTISPKDFSKVKITALPKIMIRKAIDDIQPIVKDGSLVLKEGVDYTVKYESVSNISLFGIKSKKVQVTIKNQSSNYTGKDKVVTLLLTPRSITNTLYCTIKPDKNKLDENGVPAVVVSYAGEVLKQGKDKKDSKGDYFVTVNVKKKTITVTGIGSYTGTKTIKY